MESSGSTGMRLTFDSCQDDRAPLVEASTALPTSVHSPHLPGLELKRRREERGLTLEDVARTTKINKTVLRALEASDVLHLPAPIYTRGFLKAYAREVGLHPEETADEYLRRIEPLRGHHLLVDDGLLPPVTDASPAVDVNGDARHLLAENQVRRFGWLTLAVAAGALIVYLASFTRGDEAPTPVASDAVGSADAARTGGVSDDTADAVAPAALTDEPLRVEFTPQGPCWLSIHIDGERVFAKLLQAGDRQTIDVSDEAVLRIGEPGALSYSINGRSGRALGPAGQPVTVRITKDNFREFLSS